MDLSSKSLKFGTSGLRGPVEAFNWPNISAYVAAFLDTIETDNSRVYIGIDLRESSSEIARFVCSAVAQKGMQAVYCGVLPTPALALYAMAQNAPSIMVTGSHIPATHNGLKFYRSDSELLKEDEAPIHARANELLGRVQGVPSNLDLPEVSSHAIRTYIARYTQPQAKGALVGAKIGVYLHSSASGRILVEVLESLGAEVLPFGHSDRFHAVDTEAFPETERLAAKSQIDSNELLAVVSTDGDGDRPLLIDECGQQINGDVLGAIAAKTLGVSKVVTPITSTTGLENSEWFESVLRTKVGSPFVVSGMLEAGEDAVGFEPNGGFLTGSQLATSLGKFDALPTRDALLPLLIVLITARARSLSLSSLRALLPARHMQADRLKNVPVNSSLSLLDKITRSRAERGQLHPDLSDPVSINLTDGVRLAFRDGRIVHFRASGNAPELRCYVETESAESTQLFLQNYISALRSALR